MSIILDHISYEYKENSSIQKKALKDINLKIEHGEFVGIIGHTGSGKSTLIQHLNGLLKGTNGAYYFNGEDVYDKDYDIRTLRNKVGLVFQYPEHQLFEETVYKDVAYGPKMQNLEQLEIQLRVFDALKLVGMDDSLLDASPFELSGGQKRKVAIAGVLAMKPQVLVLDEPTAGLDPYSKKELLDLIKKLHAETNITVIIVSHSMEDMAEYVERLIVMNKGSVKFDGTPIDIFANADELEQIGLSVPQTALVLNQLRKQGYLVPNSDYTVESTSEVLLKYICNILGKNSYK
ncbi:MAG: energy-coupling factor transporter ATPase [Lachnospiraceae bacterium]|nr:energy-coupling factor transporter ATPase [Lachnospiraceae bacterium]